MIILDTNVLSELVKPRPSPEVIEWLDQSAAEMWITSITVAEMLTGVARMPSGRRRELLRLAVTQLVDNEFDARVAAFDRAAAVEYAGVVAARMAAGRPISMADAEIAAICRVHGATLATRNVPDFTGTEVDVIDPWSAN